MWGRRTGRSRGEDDPGWIGEALDPCWTFYPLLTDEDSGISRELSRLDLGVEDTVQWAGREAVRLVGIFLPVGVNQATGQSGVRSTATGERSSGNANPARPSTQNSGVGPSTNCRRQRLVCGAFVQGSIRA